MIRFNQFARAATASALLAFSAYPAAVQAGEANRARSAIAEAKGKIEAGDKVGASTESPLLQSQARASLTSAEALLARGKKTEAIVEAKHAGQLADQALVMADQKKAETAAKSRVEAEVSASIAQQSAVDAEVRAAAAEQTAATATAQADALRNASAAATTTVATVEKEIVRAPVTAPAAAHVHRKKTRRVAAKAAPTAVEKTTTTVMTTPN